jgi:transcriptional regulator with XRE-family HTH domain
MGASSLLRDARQRASLTQRELAYRTGVAQPTIARIESGAADPRLATLEVLLEVCGYVVESRPRPGHGVDRTQIRELLKLTPLRRLQLLTEDVKGLAELEHARRG